MLSKFFCKIWRLKIKNNILASWNFLVRYTQLKLTTLLSIFCSKEIQFSKDSTKQKLFPCYWKVITVGFACIYLNNKKGSFFFLIFGNCYFLFSLDPMFHIVTRKCDIDQKSHIDILGISHVSERVHYVIYFRLKSLFICMNW